MKITTSTLYRGSKFTICEIVRDGHPMLKRFSQKLTSEQRTDMIALIKYVADNGPPINETRFSYEEEQIWAFKDGQVRVYCFYDRDTLIILANGAIKKTQKADPEELKKAKKLREAYLRSQQ